MTSPVYDPSFVGPGFDEGGSVSVDAMFGETWESVAPRVVASSTLGGTAGEHFLCAALAYRVRAFAGEMGEYRMVGGVGGGASSAAPANATIVKVSPGVQAPAMMMMLVIVAAATTAFAVVFCVERGPPRQQRDASLVRAVNVLKGTAMVGTLYT